MVYFIYMFGIIGLFKGVVVLYCFVVEYFVWFKGEYDVDDIDWLLQVVLFSFDVLIVEIFGMLVCGVWMVILCFGGFIDIGYFIVLLCDEGIMVMYFVLFLFGLFLLLLGVSQWWMLQWVFIGGELLFGEVVDKFYVIFDVLLYNFYGLIEIVINVSWFKVVGLQGICIVFIGWFKINIIMYLFDDLLQLVLIGVIGEIYIGGMYVVYGYYCCVGLIVE